MLRYGLTGGIASGKSTVAAMLREEGFPVLEADRISHQLMDPGQSAYNEVIAVFGKDIVNGDGRIDRGRLAEVVFQDREKLQRLNQILHPRVKEALVEQFAELEKNGAGAAAFVEAALIFEAGMDKKLDGVVVVWCLPEQQLARLIERGMKESDARQRMAMQMPVEEKLALGCERIDCSRTREETQRQVRELADRIRKQSRQVQTNEGSGGRRYHRNQLKD